MRFWCLSPKRCQILLWHCKAWSYSLCWLAVRSITELCGITTLFWVFLETNTEILKSLSHTIGCMWLRFIENWATCDCRGKCQLGQSRVCGIRWPDQVPWVPGEAESSREDVLRRCVGSCELRSSRSLDGGETTKDFEEGLMKRVHRCSQYGT